MAKKIFLGNYKGGVGKTTSTFYLAKYFAELIANNPMYASKKVLLLDIDPQCSLSEVCIKSNNSHLTLTDISNDETLNFVLDIMLKNNEFGFDIQFDNQKLIKQCTQLNANTYFIPTSLYYRRNDNKDDDTIGLDGIIEAMQRNPEKNIFLFNNFIKSVENDYAFIFIDCPPSNSILSQSAFLLSDYYLIPMIRDNISVKGVEHYISTVHSIYSKYCNNHPDAFFYTHEFGKEPELLGLFECMRIRNENPRGTLANLNKYRCYNTVIKNLIDIQEKMSQGKISDEHGLYKDLANEIFANL